MMKLLILACLFAVSASADRLDNVYLPPTNTRNSGGSGNILKAPFRENIPSGSYPSFSKLQSTQPDSLYGTPQQSSIKSFSTGPAQAPIAILRLNNNNNGEGTYQFDFETENKISQQESGQLKNSGSDQESNVVQGSYSYVGPDGKTYSVNYVADELGFRATGEHLPVAPPVPEEILKALEQNAADEAKGIIDDGQYRPEVSEKAGAGFSGRQYLAPKVEKNNERYQQNGYKY